MEKLEKTTIRKKLLDSFKKMSFFTKGIGAVAVVFILITNILYAGAMNNYGFAQGSVGKFQAEVEKSRYFLSELVNATQTDEKEKYSKELSDSNTIVESLLPGIEESNTTTEEERIYEEIFKLKEKYGDNIGKIIELVMKNQNDEAKEILQNQQMAIMNKMESGLSELLDTKIIDGKNITNILYGAGVIQVLAIIVLILISNKRSKTMSEHYANEIGNPIAQIAGVAEKISHGDLDADIDITSDDEIGDLAESFKVMALNLKKYIIDISRILENLSQKNLTIQIEEEYEGDFIQIKDSLNVIIESMNEVFAEIKKSTEEVNGGSSQIADTAQIISQGAVNQADEINNLLETVAQVNEQVHDNLEKAEFTNDIFKELIKNVEEQKQNVGDLVKTMNDINSASIDVKGIINVIEDISDQTNLLALNAAIEAARAGEMGKGFAVVAEEVRQLSNQTSEAVNQTKLLIEKAISTSGSGKDVVDKTSSSLLNIIENIEKSGDMVDGITNASNEQANSLENINNSIAEISEVVASNSSISEESAAASEELTAQAETLNSMIEQFRLK